MSRETPQRGSAAVSWAKLTLLLPSPRLRDEYFRMKLQWKSVSPEQERRNSLLHGYRSLIGGWRRGWGCQARNEVV